MLRNQRGVIYVGLMKHGNQYKKAVAHLVAQTFLLDPYNEAFDTVINLDGDRSNNCVENLQWRPMWFTRKYFRQFEPDAPRGFDSPIEDILSGETFDTSWQAAIKYGLLDREILLATLNRTYVWPTFQRFRKL